jgi:hypothetical protein
LAEISKLSGVAIANVAKVDAVTKANIANINDLTIPSAAAFLLDTYTGAAAAYSVRRLATATTVLLRVRRDTAGGTGDDDEADVAYDSNDELSLDSAISNASAGVTATTLGQFINVGTVGGTTYTNPDSLTGTASCFVDTWYDQASTNDAEQTTHDNQPQIHDGTVDTDLIKENGKAAVEFDGSNDVLISASFVPLIRTASQVMTKSASTSSSAIWRHNEGDIQFTRVRFSGSFQTRFIGTIATGALNTQAVAICHTQSDITTSGTAYTYYNGTETSASNATFSVTSSGPVFIGNNSATGTELWLGTIQEVVLWTTYWYNDNSGIQTDVNDHFSIF